MDVSSTVCVTGCYFELMGRSKQHPLLCKDSFINFAVLICTYCLKGEKNFINLVKLRQAQNKYLVLRSLNLLQQILQRMYWVKFY